MEIFKAAIIGAALASALPVAAGAQTFTIGYSTFNDGQHPSVSLTGTLTAVASQVAGAYSVTGFTGFRNGVAITSFDPTSAFYYPAKVPATYQFSTYFDAGQVTLDFYTADGTEYLLSRGPSDSTFYREFEDPYGNTIGRLIQPSAITIAPKTATAVPEPASWALMVTGFALAGTALRRRRAPALASA